MIGDLLGVYAMPDRLKAIGFWKNLSEAKHLWHPRGLVDEQWQPHDKDGVIQYVRNGIICDTELGHSFCRFRDGPPPEEMGDAYLTDGIWLWPQGLWVYVQDYNVRLPDEFIETIRSHSYRIPEGLDANALQGLGWDDGFWRQWCKAHYHRRSPVHAISDWLWLFRNRGL